MEFNNLSKKDTELIKKVLEHQSLVMTAETLQRQQDMDKETFTKKMEEADRLTYLVKVICGEAKYSE